MVPGPDDERDYGLPPRRPSPSLIDPNVVHPPRFFEMSVNQNVIPFTNKKKKKKGVEEEDCFYIESSDDDEISVIKQQEDEEMPDGTRIKQEIKEEPMEEPIVLSDDEVDEDEIVVLKENLLDDKTRRRMWREKYRGDWKQKRNKRPRLGTSASFQSPVSALSSARAPAAATVARDPEAGGHSNSGGESGQTPVVQGETLNSASGGNPQPQPPLHTQDLNRNQTPPPGNNEQNSNMPSDPSPQVTHNTINVQFEPGRSLLVDIPGHPQLKLTAVQDPVLPPPPPAQKPTQLTTKNSQTGHSILNGVFFSPRPDIDLSQPSPPGSNTASETSGQGEAQSSPNTVPNNTANAENTSAPRSNAQSTSRRVSPDSDSMRRDHSESPSRSRRHRSHHRRSTSRSNSPVQNRSRRSGPSPPPKFNTFSELIDYIRSCRRCKRTFENRDKGVHHQKFAHSKKYCPICFKLISRGGNAWRDHIRDCHQVKTDGDGVEKVKCNFCTNDYEFEGVYSHVGKIHLKKIEKRRARSQPRSGTDARTRSSTSTASATATSRPVPVVTPNTAAARATARRSSSSSTNSSTSSAIVASEPRTHSSIRAEPHANPSPPRTTVSTSHSTRSGTGRYVIPRRSPSTATATQQQSSSSTSTPRVNNPGAELERVLSPADIGRLKVIYKNKDGIPENHEIAQIAADLGVIRDEVTSWFVQTHRKRKTKNAKSRLLNKRK